MNQKIFYIRAMRFTYVYIVALIISSFFSTASWSQDSNITFLKTILKNSYRKDVCSYSILYKIKSNEDTLTFKYFVTLVNKPEEFSYSVLVNDSLLEVYYDNILLLADLSNTEYTLSVLSKKEICAESRYLFRSMVDEGFPSILLDDSVVIQKHLETDTSYIFNITYLNPGQLDKLFYTIKVSKNTKSISEYSLSASVAGISLWESLKLSYVDTCTLDSIEDVSRKKFFNILKTYKPKCENAQNGMLRDEMERAPSIHDSLPFLKLISLENDTISISDYSSKYYLIDYWYRACFPCIKSIPILKELHDKFNESQLKIISINNVDKSKDLIEKFILDNNLPYSVYMESVESGKIFNGIVSYPTFVIYNDKFQVIKILNGYSDDLKEKILGIIEGND